MATATAPELLAQAKPARSHLPFILGLALVARLLMVVAYYHATSLRPLHMFGDEDVAIASSICAGQGFASPFQFPSGPTAFLAPGYPYLIAGVIRVLGTGLAAANTLVAFQMLLSLLTVFLVMKVARAHFGTRAAHLAGLVSAIAEPFLLPPLYVWDTCISALLLTVAVLVAPRVNNRLQFGLTGAGCAIATLINPSLLPALVAIFAWSAWRSRIVPWLGLVVFLIVYSPWPVRNYVRMHAFIPLRSNAGYELWQGNPGVDGESPVHSGLVFRSDDRNEFLAKGEVKYMADKGALARAWIGSHPREFARLTASRFLRFWSGSSKSPGDLTIPLVLAGMVGLVLLWRCRSLFVFFALPLVVYPLPYYITHADARFQFVIDPLLAILVGYACERFLAFVARRPAPLPAASPQFAASNPPCVSR